MPGAGQHAAGLRHDREDMAGLPQVFRARVGRDSRLDGFGPVMRRNAGRDALGGFD